uniref:Uncharacterized protein n=1 Tax=Anguilla anguilla TaxID=7936 RepID=A0A0E9RH20_ANGAN
MSIYRIYRYVFTRINIQQN